jgi:hypothetical protein
MLQSYKGRELKAGQQVMVYFNLHTHLFSVKDMKTGKVVAHGNNIILEDVSYKVSEAGRQRVLREQKKNVHAYVVGKFVGTAESMAVPMRQAYYNPYTVETFIDKESGRELRESQMAYLKDKQVQYI